MKLNFPVDWFVRILVRPVIQLRKLYFLLIKRYFDFDKEKYFSNTDLKIDVIIPTTGKDLDVLAYCIAGIKEHVKHKICNICIVSPKNTYVKKFCKDNSYKYFVEDSVIPFERDKISYSVDNIDRSGWIIQQFIKYSESLSEQDYYLTVDSDTVFIRPQSYIRGNKTLLLVGDDFFPPYARMVKKLLGHTSFYDLTMVCHQNFFSKSEITKLKTAIESHTGMKWYEAILQNLQTNSANISFAENFTYAYWINRSHRKFVVKEYFYNKRVFKSDLSKIDLLKTKFQNKYKSLSFQVYVN